MPIQPRLAAPGPPPREILGPRGGSGNVLTALIPSSPSLVVTEESVDLLPLSRRRARLFPNRSSWRSIARCLLLVALAVVLGSPGGWPGRAASATAARPVSRPHAAAASSSTILLPLSPKGRGAASGVPAFPGAEGWGARAWQACDRSQVKVIEVTNLNDSGPGSLRAALKAAGTRIVVFRVAGRIELLSRIDVRGNDGNSCLYVAGQTAPGGGIWVSNAPVAASYSSIGLQEDVHDVIIRGLRVRPNSNGAIDIEGGHDIILDHLSMGWTTEDTLDIWYGTTTRSRPISRVSVQRSLLSEAYARHSTFMNIGGEHATGNETDVDRISIHHNLMGHASHRAPNVSAASASVVNNVVYNTKWKGTITKHSTTTDIIGNYYAPGPMSVLVTSDPNAPAAYRFLVHESTDPSLVPYTPGASLFVQGNVLRPGLTDTTADGWPALWDEYLNQPLDPRYRRSPWRPHAPAPVPVAVASAYGAYDSVVLAGDVGDYRRLACDGAWVVRRDAVDQRLIDDLRAGTQWFSYVDSAGARRYPDTLDEVGHYPPIDPGTPCADADHDGMPDAWEVARGLNPGDPTDAVRLNADGYTNVESYINGG
jgi:pectate lyase